MIRQSKSAKEIAEKQLKAMTSNVNSDPSRDASQRFLIASRRGSPEKGLKILAKLDKHFGT